MAIAVEINLENSDILSSIKFAPWFQLSIQQNRNKRGSPRARPSHGTTLISASGLGLCFPLFGHCAHLGSCFRTEPLAYPPWTDCRLRYSLRSRQTVLAASLADHRTKLSLTATLPIMVDYVTRWDAALNIITHCPKVASPAPQFPPGYPAGAHPRALRHFLRGCSRPSGKCFASLPARSCRLRWRSALGIRSPARG